MTAPCVSCGTPTDRRRLVAVLVVLSLLLAAVIPLRAGGTPTDAYCVAPADADMLARINAYRVDQGRSALAMSQTLGAAAEHHALDMPNQDPSPTHVLSTGETWLTNIANHGYPMEGTLRGENIGWGFGGSNDLMLAWWQGSAGHDANLLDSRWTAVGVKRVEVAGSYWGYYWVLDFGTVLDVAATGCDGAAPTETVAPEPTKACANPNGRGRWCR